MNLINSISNSRKTISSVGLLTSMPSEQDIRGVYAFKWVNNKYSGPIIKLRKSSDTTGVSTKDFYMDKTGTKIGELLGGNGTSLTTWLGTDSAYVVKWYDQSTKGYNISQDSISIQPIFDYTNKRINFTASNYLPLPFGMIRNGNYSHSIVLRIDNTNILHNQTILFYGGGGQNSYGFGCATWNDLITYDIVGNSLGISSSKIDNKIISLIYNSSSPNTRVLSLDKSASSASSNFGLNVQYNANNAISRIGSGDYSIYSLFVYESVLSSVDRLFIENI